MGGTEVLCSPARAVAAAVREAAIAIGAAADFTPHVERPADPTHGEYSSNAALVLSGRLGRRPHDIATDLAERIDCERAGVSDVSVAGPGFLNFRLSDRVLWDGLRDLLSQDVEWGRSTAAHPLRYNVEFVSANPTGPLHVAHGRGAAIGDATASLLEWTGHDVTREFYVNDAGAQIDKLIDVGFAEIGLGDLRSARGRFIEALDRSLEVQLDGITAYALIGIGNVFAGSGESAEAVEILSVAARHPAVPNEYKRDYVEPALTRLRGDMGPDLFETAASRSVGWTVEDVIAVARAASSGPAMRPSGGSR